MNYYAQLDENKICVCISSLVGEVNLSNMIMIDSFNTDLLGKKYQDGEWLD